MKHIFRLLTLAVAGLAIGFHFDIAQAAPAPQGTSKTQIELCGEGQNYLFALCAASTCTDTGKRIAVNTPRGGKRWFKEVSCTCPVVNTNSSNTGLTGDLASAFVSSLPAIANVTGGNMKGSCDYPVAGHPEAGVWSLYSTATSFPQATALATVQNPHPAWTTQPATWNHCSASLNQGREFTNCFSFKCGAPHLNDSGVLVSDCSCPKGEDVFSALPTVPAKSFFTDAGGNETDRAVKDQYCQSHPVGGF